jgi:uncharacterized YigZ family protein
LKTILRQYESTLKDKGSKFLGYLIPCESEEQFREALDQLKKEFYDATHHCYAYRIDPNTLTEFSSDDGEPSGTAGLPILNQLKSAELINTGAVIVRYYGGTKLGKSGLIEAYKGATHLLTEKANLKEVIPVQLYEIEYPYSEELVYSKMETDFDLLEQSADYTDSVKKVIGCKTERIEDFVKYHKRVKHLGITLSELEKTFVLG